MKSTALWRVATTVVAAATSPDRSIRVAPTRCSRAKAPISVVMGWPVLVASSSRTETIAALSRAPVTRTVSWVLRGVKRALAIVHSTTACTTCAADALVARCWRLAMARVRHRVRVIRCPMARVVISACVTRVVPAERETTARGASIRGRSVVRPKGVVRGGCGATQVNVVNSAVYLAGVVCPIVRRLRTAVIRTRARITTPVSVYREPDVWSRSDIVARWLLAYQTAPRHLSADVSL